MTHSFQPQIIRRDSVVPLRLIASGWVIGVISIMSEEPVASRIIALMGITLLAGGAVALTMSKARLWRMLIGASAGAVTIYLGFRFAVADRLWPARGQLREIAHRPHLAAIAVGLAVLAIGVGAVLEAVRAQSEPGSSPAIVRVALISIGMFMAASLCSLAGVRVLVTLLVTLAVAAGLAAMSWLRRERPAEWFYPAP